MIAPGALDRLRVVELAGIGPGPFAAMMLGDLGAHVDRVDRPSAVGTEHPLMGPPSTDVLARGRRSIAIDLKSSAGRGVLRAMLATADVLIDPFRPGVLERLDLDPEMLGLDHPALITCRVTGWGQTGPYAHRAGHDLTYLAATGALHAIGPADAVPPPPLNLIADFGGGGMLAVVGILAALVERGHSGRGQVVDAAMVDGVTTLMASLYGWHALGRWSAERGDNLLDGAAPFYRTYRTADGEHVAVGALEPQFYLAFLTAMDVDPADWPQDDRGRWPALTALLARAFAEHDLDHWRARFADVDACVEPVLRLDQAWTHPALADRHATTLVGAVRQPSPAPRLARTPSAPSAAAPGPGEHTLRLLAELGFEATAADALVRAGAVAQAELG